MTKSHEGACQAGQYYAEKEDHRGTEAIGERATAAWSVHDLHRYHGNSSAQMKKRSKRRRISIAFILANPPKKAGP